MATSNWPDIPNVGDNIHDSVPEGAVATAAYVAASVINSFPSNVPYEDRMVVTLEVCLDDSGTHDGSPRVLVGGFAATAEDWASFAAEWQKALKDKDRGLPYFHMSECAHFEGAFKGWTEERRRELLAELTDVIIRHAWMPVGLAIDMEDFNAAFAGYPLAEGGVVYSMAATLVMPFLCLKLEELKVSDEVQLAYIFDAGAEGTGLIQTHYSGMVRHRLDLLWRVNSVRFARKETFLPLQAADLVAYEMFKFPAGGARLSQTRWPMRRVALAAATNAMYLVTREQLFDMRQRLDQVLSGTFRAIRFRSPLRRDQRAVRRL